MSADQSTIAQPLRGRVALVTGVSRRVGIGYTVAVHLANLGATVFRTGWPPHDDEMPWGADTPNDHDDFGVERRNLEDPSQPAALIDAVVASHGAIDIVIAVHARSSDGSLAELSGDELDRCWAANVRSIVLLAQQFSKRHDPTRVGGRMIWFTSGQGLGPMPDVLPYTITKAALSGMTASIAVPLADVGIIANCINPGPVDTGYATGEVHARVAARFPAGRWGTPGDVANLVAFLVSDEGAWIVGQVLNSEGGFRRH
jgi:3-oxoacyl-[acyl-carrier protein] reductase